MNAPVATSPTQGTRPTYNQAIVKGKITERRRHEKSFFTRVITPAPDPYSRPQTLDIRSKASLGQVGDEVVVPVQLGGYTRKPFRYTDKDTGETTMVTPVDHTLDAVE